MEDVFEVLATDHEEIRQVLAELEKGPTAATGAGEDQLMLRKIMTEELIVEEAKHGEIERTDLWPAVRVHVPGGGQLADRAICQQIEIGELLAELDKLDASDPEFEEFLTEFTRAGRAHFDFEEGHVWPRLRTVLTMKAATEMGRKILQGRQAAVALPRPRASAWPGGMHYRSFG